MSEWKVFPARHEAYTDMLVFITEGAEAANISMKSQMKLELGFEEAVVNVISYAYDEPGELLLKYSVDAGCFVVEIVDYGIPFDPFSAEERQDSVQKVDSIEKAGIGGLGIPFMKKSFVNPRYAREEINGKEANHLILPIAL